jgi:hypothetical protein
MKAATTLRGVTSGRNEIALGRQRAVAGLGRSLRDLHFGEFEFRIQREAEHHDVRGRWPAPVCATMADMSAPRDQPTSVGFGNAG